MSLIPNKLLLNLLACGLIFSSPTYAFPLAVMHNTLIQNQHSLNKWESFTDQENGFSVSFPKTPQHVKQSIEIPQTQLKIAYETYLSEPSESVVYVVSVWHYPPEIDMSKPEVNLQDGFKGMLSALPGSEVIDSKMDKINGFQALEFLVKNEDIYFQGKLILVYNSLYQVFTVYKDTEEMSEAYSHFMSSFKLIHPEKHKPASPTPSVEKLNI